MVDKRRGIMYLMAVLLVVIAPTAFSLAWYQISKNPNLRPLGITQQSLMSYATGFFGGSDIVAYVDWVAPRTGGFAKEQLRTAITNAFLAKGADVRVVFREGKGRTTIIYQVGKSSIGPYPTSRAAEGISAAVEAMKMYPDLED